MLSYSVAQRTQEIGVRVALGASRREVLSLIVGTACCSPASASWSASCSRRCDARSRSLLYNVSPFDPMTFGGVAVFLLVVALVASWVPALRATRVDPLMALSGE